MLSGCPAATATAPAAKAPAAVEVISSVPIHTEIVEWDEFVGRLEPTDFVEIRARVSGYLHSINFHEGQIVKQGDLLCVIDPRPFEVEVNRATSEVRLAVSQGQQAAATVTQTEAEVEESEARHELSQKQLARSRSLVQQNAISQDEYDVRESEVRQSEANLRAVRARLLLAQTAVTSSEAQINSAETSLATAKLNLEYTQVRAPITGRVSSKLVTEGNLISGGQAESTLITRIVSLDPIYCTFDADELSFLKYERLAKEGKLGDTRSVRHPVYIGLANEPNEFPHAGYLNFVDNRLDPGTGTMRLRAILKNSDHLLTPGLFTRVRIPGSGRYEATMIPDFAVGTDQSEKFVLVINDENKIERRVVELGPLYRGNRIIREGMSPTDRFVLRGMQRVRAGVSVDPTHEAISLNNESLPEQADPIPDDKTISRPAYNPMPGTTSPKGMLAGDQSSSESEAPLN
ncbi:MAG TPA: efflux RND transporter periplasmic adaptor subunit [Planctomicrobium sp.]|nr:efflux RND transporter periplasmic adaptor subunit [Planctomicrobium sp.]